MSLLRWHLPTALEATLATPCPGKLCHTTQMMSLSSCQALLWILTLMINSVNPQQNKSYNWIVTFTTSLQNIQDQYLPSIKDASYVRRPGIYTRVPSLQPKYSNVPQTCMINIYSSTTVHNNNNHKGSTTKMELKILLKILNLENGNENSSESLNLENGTKLHP